jgi:hypothetical protein
MRSEAQQNRNSESDARGKESYEQSYKSDAQHQQIQGVKKQMQRLRSRCKGLIIRGTQP